MSTFLQANDALNNRPAPIADDVGTVLCVRSEITLTTAQVTALLANDVIEMLKLPADHVIVDAILDTDALGTTLATNWGVFNDDPGSVSASSTISQALNSSATSLASAAITRATGVAAVRGTPNKTTARSIGLKISAAATAAQAGGKIGLTIFYRTSRYAT